MGPFLPSVLLGLLVASSIAFAQPFVPYPEVIPVAESSQDKAREAVRRDSIKTFAEIMAIARARIVGDIVKIELERKKGRWEYEIRILSPKGRRWELKIDAVSGQILEIE